jgi:hypothetical protein
VQRTAAGSTGGAPACRALDDAPLRKCAANDKPAVAAAANLSSSPASPPVAPALVPAVLHVAPRVVSELRAANEEFWLGGRFRADGLYRPAELLPVRFDAKGEVVQTRRMWRLSQQGRRRARRRPSEKRRRV